MRKHVLTEEGLMKENTNMLNVLEIAFNKLCRLIKYPLDMIHNRVVLVDTPVHGNLGDQAIAVAEKQILDRKCPNKKYTEVTAIDINRLEKIYAGLTPKKHIILVHGGGFLGTLWPEEEYRFRRIIKAFHNNKIIVFPQTVTFDLSTEAGRNFCEESRHIYYSHPDLTIMVREKKSYDFMKENMPKIKVALLPDIVTMLELDSVGEPRKDILLCMRADSEKIISDKDTDRIISILKNKYSDYEIHVTDMVLDHFICPQKRVFEVENKIKQFEQHKMVVTDRLHGMIFAAITNTPCIAMGNINGKVKSVYETWLSNNQYVKYANNVDEFEQMLKELDLNEQYLYDPKQVRKAFRE
jgi:pyruvyl transferase EpsI